MSRIRTIVIKKVNPDGTLDLGNDKDKRAWKSDFVVWKIRENSGVQSITKFELKPNTDNVFVTMPYENGSEWFAQVMSTVQEGMECRYNIYWKDKDGNERKHDPIITIKPSFFDFEPIEFFDTSIGVLVGAVVGAIASLLYWRKQRMSLKRENERLKNQKPL